MPLLVRIARQQELPEEGKIVKEAHGRKVLLARTGGQLFATDAHCFHMGGNLWEGDIEDVGGHACVVCPLHRYKIDMATGQKVDTMLDGCVSCSSSQQQRTYTVYQDADYICIDIPELRAQKLLPSDRYNQVAPAMAPAAGFLQQVPAPGATPSHASYGLFGSSSSRPASLATQPEPLAPYAGFQNHGLVPATPAKDGMDDEGAMLSQGSGAPLNQGPPSAQEEEQQQQMMAAQQQQWLMQQQAHHAQGHIPFAQSRVYTARIARRKAATAAIVARAYVPPSAPPPSQLAPRGLFSTSAARLPQQQRQAPLATGDSGPRRTVSGGGQQSLLNFGFTVQQHNPPVVSTGQEAMEME